MAKKRRNKAAANEFMLDRTIRHQVYLQRVKTQTAQEIVGLINDKVVPDLLGLISSRLQNIATRGFDTGPATTTRLGQLLQSTQRLVNQRFEEVGTELVSKLEEVAGVEADWVAKTMSESTGLIVDFTAPNPVTLEAIVTSRPFNGKILSEWWDGVAAATQEKVQTQLNIGLVQGESVDEMVRRLRGTRDLNYADGILQGTRRDVEAVVRTATNHVSTQAREITFEENTDVLKGIQIVATLDTRTTPICRAQDGKIYPVNEGPRPPFHWGCRTTVVPVLKSAAELDFKSLGLKEIPETTRASMDGQVAATTTYGEWLSEQPASIQDQVLGPTRALAYRKGDITIDQFVDDKGKTLTIAELKKLELL